MHRRIYWMASVLVIVFPIFAPAQSTIPNAYETTPGNGTFLGPLANSQRTYQWLINSNQLTSFVGQELTGLAMRIPTSATAAWPLAGSGGVTFTNFDIYMSESVTPADRSLTFANNIVGTQTQVRSGSLSIAESAYPFGATPNSFGPVISFTPWLYNGSHLLIELRHTGFSGTSRSVEALTTSAPGYLSDFAAAWTGSYTGTAGSAGNFSVIQITSQPVPEPGSIALMTVAGIVFGWRRLSKR
jgi:hypothetical protein